MSFPITTPRLDLIPVDLAIFEAIDQGDQALSAKLGVTVPMKWSLFGRKPFQHAAAYLKAHKEIADWWIFFAIHREENLLIGNGGYQGPPDERGWVEIGYEIIRTHRNQGFATEFAKALTVHALQQEEVRGVRAHTISADNASAAVLKNCGFSLIKKGRGNSGIPIWRWETEKGTRFPTDSPTGKPW